MKKTEIAVGCRRGRHIRYALLTTIGEDGSPRYGAAVAYAGEETLVPDITADFPKALSLLELLHQGSVLPAALRDVVEDWLLL